MAEDNKNFTAAAPMLIGEEFAKQATTTVEQVKVMKKLTITSEEFFRILPPKLSQWLRGWIQGRPCKIPPIQRKPDRAALHPPRSKQPRTKTISTNVVNFYQETINYDHTVGSVKYCPQ